MMTRKHNIFGVLVTCVEFLPWIHFLPFFLPLDDLFGDVDWKTLEADMRFSMY